MAVLVAIALVQFALLHRCLLAANERRIFIESLPQLVWTCEPDGPCDYLSPQWVAYTGVPEEQQRGYQWLQVLHAEDRQPTLDRWKAIAPLGGIFDIRFRIRRHDGVYRWFQSRATPVKDASGKVIKWYGSNTDVQDLLDAQIALAQFENAQRIAHVGSWRTDPTSKAIEWSDEMFRICGLPVAEAAPSWVDQVGLFGQSTREQLLQVCNRALRDGQPFELEHEIVRPNGEVRCVIARGEPSRDDEGRIVQLLGTVHDITEFRRAQRAVEAEIERIRLAVNAAVIGIWEWDIGSGKLSWDGIMFRLYGREAGGSLDYSVWQSYLHPDDVRVTVERLARALAGEAEFAAEFRIVRPDGSIRYLQGNASVHRSPDGSPSRVVGVNWDITEEREARANLLANEHLLREFVIHVPAAIAMMDAQVRYMHASERWISEYRLGGQNIIGRSHYEVFPEIPQHWKDVHQRVLATGIPERCDDDLFPRADGTNDYVTWEVRPWRKGDGSIGGMLFFTQVTTEKKKLALALKQQAEDLARSNRDLEQFAYVASHDLQEPLRAVAGCGQILQRRYAKRLDSSADDLIEHIVQGADRMQRLIQDLLAYSRVGVRAFSVTLTDSAAAARSALANLQAAIAETKAKITLHSLPEVRADRAHLEQLFQNLIANAIKYHGPEPPEIVVAAERRGDMWQFSVRDNGIGIEPQYLQRIFMLFQRLHTREEYPGTGIGLAICQKIVERHGGRMWADSRVGEGSTFHFTLPA